MTDKVITKEEWSGSLESLKESYRLFGPVKDGDFHTFMLLEGDKKPDFDYENSRLSPKAVVYPESERMFEYSLDENEADAHILKESPKDYSPCAVLGIRPCDAHAFQIVRRNFDNPEYQDPWWTRHFEATTLVGLGCNEPCASCFCTQVGDGPFNETGLDVLLYDFGDHYLARALTDKGEAFLQKTPGSSPDKADFKSAEELTQQAEGKITARVPTDQLKKKITVELFDAPFWEEVAFPCLNCGTCTYLCPTCWCFDIQDEMQGKQGDRIRNWDSCMFPLFSLHGSGHNPRDNKFQRVRQRFMHKLKYYVDKYGNGVQCSGCGRCVKYCPVNIDIRKVCKLMNDFSQ